MQIGFKTLYLKKRFPLRISRGIKEGGYNLFVSLEKDGITGWGEMAPGSSEGAETAEEGQKALEKFWTPEKHHLSISQIYDIAIDEGLPACALAALDMALWDWLGKKAGLPLYQLLGLPKPKNHTSVTIGINPPDVVKERVPILLDGTGVKNLKIKLGSPEGTDADKSMYSQVVESTRNYDVNLRVDANGGWSTDDAIMMMKWLSERKCDYVEQPLVEGAESELEKIYKNRPVPIFVDESCRFSSQIPAYAEFVDGVNLKLMKCGGITEALRILATARAFGLKTMIGCMGESSVSISAGAALTGIIDHVDLDSHLNLNPDPAEGALLINGIITPTDAFGHGASLKDND